MDFDLVDVVNASMSLRENSLMSKVGTAMLSKAIDTAQDMNSEMVKAMEQSVNPGVGSNVDIRV